MFGQFTLFLDCSAQIIPSHLRQITPFVKRVFQQVLHSFPLSQCALAIVNDQRAYLEVGYTQSLDSLLVPLVMDQVTPAGSFSLANALRLLSTVSTSSFQQKVGFLVSFSSISYDSLNIFAVTEELQRKGAQFSAVSVGANMQVLRTVTDQLGGFYHILQSLEQLSAFTPEFKFPPHKAAPVLVSLSRSLPKRAFCSCCGRLQDGVRICQNCGAALCSSKVCPVCGIYVCDLFEVRRAGIVRGFTTAMQVERACGFCGDSGAFCCMQCNVAYCARCHDLADKIGMCGSCGQ